MKKTLLFIFMLAITFANAQFSDNIESYPLGLMTENANWGSWDQTDGTADDISVSDDVAHSGTKSVLVAEGVAIDGVLKLGDKTSGTWYLEWFTYIPSGSNAYFNIQNTEAPGVQWNNHLYYNQDGADVGGITLYDATGANQGPGNVLGTGFYSEDSWIKLSMEINLDAATMVVSINDVELFSGGYTGDQIGGINFYSGHAANRYYIDDVTYSDAPIASVNDLESLGFNAYPNPVKNDLFLNANENITNVSIYNVIGQEVKSLQPNALESTIDMSDLISGAYFVKVNIGSTVGTIKVMK